MKKKPFTELSLNKTTKQEINIRGNSGHLTSSVHILQQAPETHRNTTISEESPRVYTLPKKHLKCSETPK